jgi:hypothetical protein
MDENRNTFRLLCYLGAGSIFLGLLAFIFLGFPGLTPPKLPTQDSEDGQKQRSDTRPELTDQSGSRRSISATPGTPGDEAGKTDDFSIAGEIVLKAASKEELAKLVSRALAAGGMFDDFIPALLSARIKFNSRDQAEAFRKSLGENESADQNFVVMAPDFPNTDGGGGQPDNRSGQTTSSQQLQPFGDRALQFLGVDGDNSTWGNNVTIAILDSGVYPHEALSGININQIDLVQTPEDPQADYTGHGTAVADIAHIVAPSSDLLSIRVLDSDGVGDTFNVAQGIIAAVDHGADIINLSLGSYGDSIVLRDAVNYATTKGVAIVAATGNDGIEQVSYPAAYDGVIGVTAVDASGQFADFSNYGDTVDFGAPGVGVYTAWDLDSERSFSGTSAASPFVAGAIAAALSRNPGFTTEQAVQNVQQSARDTGESGQDPLTGFGVLQLVK